MIQDSTARQPGDNPFWRFSLQVYARPGVGAACIALQDRLGLDVNLVLACCWSGPGAPIGAWLAAVSDWQRDVVAPLRTVRRRLARLGEDALKRQAQALELAAERGEQDRLAALMPSGPGTPESAIENIRAYGAAVEADWSAEDAAAVARLLQGAFPRLATPAAKRLAAHLLR